MAKLHYHLVDVFTNQKFGGNPLAVFTDAQGIPANLMQQIAKELNLSETTFVLPPQDPNHDFWVRIFTPVVEMPAAGHPTVGTAYVLAREGLAAGEGDTFTMICEEGVGPISVTVEMEDGVPVRTVMSQPLPTFGPVHPDPELVASMLSIDPSGIDPAYPLEVVSVGVPFLFVPLRDLVTIQSIKLRLDIWDQHLKNWDAAKIFVFTQETEYPGSTVHSRMFAPSVGVLEDAATGIASGPLGCYLVKHGIIKADPTAVIISEQGVEMGRPSFINIAIDTEGDMISGVRISGETVDVGEGYIYA